MTREVRSLLPIVLYGIQHPLITKAVVTIGKITLPLLAYYLQIVLLQTITENQGSGDYLEELLSKYSNSFYYIFYIFLCRWVIMNDGYFMICSSLMNIATSKGM